MVHPEVMIGIPAQVEVELGMKDVTPTDFADRFKDQPTFTPEEEAVPDAEVVTTPEAELHTAPTAAPKPQTSPDQERFDKLVDMIIDDLTDAPSVDEVIELYQEQIDKMASAAPAAHERLMASVEEFRAAQS